MLAKAPRGTRDILPGDIEAWQHLESCFSRIAREYGYREIRTPLFEHTELFQRGVGEDTDIVGKEMYTFQDKGNRSITLRPEGTASTVRAFLEHRLYARGGLTKLFYLGPMFRYDRPQAGRYRQFYQLGVEALGSPDARLDAETICLAASFFRQVGLGHLSLEINTVGCPGCRPGYRQLLQGYLAPRVASLCPDCRRRYSSNPLRVLDCKEGRCRETAGEAPDISGSLCPGCREHYHRVKDYLAYLGLPYRENPRMVRGLDYYTRTAFEMVDPRLEAQGSLGGGGRYDGLVEVCGGPPTPAIGFALGLDRLVLALESHKIPVSRGEDPLVFLAALGEEASREGLKLAVELRENRLPVEKDYLGRSLKAQMKQANRLGARYVLILGEAEIARRVIIARDMENGEQEEIPRDHLVKHLQEKLLKQ